MYRTILLIAVLLLRRLTTTTIVSPAKAAIQVFSGCRIKSGMTALAYLIAGLIALNGILGLVPSVWAACPKNCPTGCCKFIVTGKTRTCSNFLPNASVYLQGPLSDRPGLGSTSKMSDAYGYYKFKRLKCVDYYYNNYVYASKWIGGADFWIFWDGFSKNFNTECYFQGMRIRITNIKLPCGQTSSSLFCVHVCRINPMTL